MLADGDDDYADDGVDLDQQEGDDYLDSIVEPQTEVPGSAATAASDGTVVDHQVVAHEEAVRADNTTGATRVAEVAPPERSTAVLVLGADGAARADLVSTVAAMVGGSVVHVQQLATVEAASESALGVQLRELTSRGKIVPAAMLQRVALQAMERLPAPHLLVEYPRAPAQLQQLEAASGRVACALALPGEEERVLLPLLRRLRGEERLTSLSSWDASEAASALVAAGAAREVRPVPIPAPAPAPALAPASAPASPPTAAGLTGVAGGSASTQLSASAEASGRAGSSEAVAPPERSTAVLVLGADGAARADLVSTVAAMVGGSVVHVQQLATVEAASESALGVQLRELTSRGKIVPAAMLQRVALQAMERLPAPHLLVEYPRAPAQLQQLEAASGRVACALALPGEEERVLLPLLRRLRGEERLTSLSSWDASEAASALVAAGAAREVRPVPIPAPAPAPAPAAAAEAAVPPTRAVSSEALRPAQLQPPAPAPPAVAPSITKSRAPSKKSVKSVPASPEPPQSDLSLVSTNQYKLRDASTLGRGTSMRAIDLDEDGDVREQLKEALRKDAVRVIDLFREWDEDGDGDVSKAEFRKAMPLLGLHVPKKEIDALFDEWDNDGSGTINLKELNAQLRASVELDAALQVGAAGEIELTRTQGFKLRDASSLGRGTFLGGIDLEEDGNVREQLKEALRKNAVRVIDLFREWDEDGDGTVSKKEFRKAMPLLGLHVPRKEIDALFEEWDPDGSGDIDMKELNKVLRRSGDTAAVPTGPKRSRVKLTAVLATQRHIERQQAGRARQMLEAENRIGGAACVAKAKLEDTPPWLLTYGKRAEPADGWAAVGVRGAYGSVTAADMARAVERSRASGERKQIALRLAATGVDIDRVIAQQQQQRRQPMPAPPMLHTARLSFGEFRTLEVGEMREVAKSNYRASCLAAHQEGGGDATPTLSIASIPPYLDEGAPKAMAQPSQAQSAPVLAGRLTPRALHASRASRASEMGAADRPTRPSTGQPSRRRAEAGDPLTKVRLMRAQTASAIERVRREKVRLAALHAKLDAVEREHGRASSRPTSPMQAWGGSGVLSPRPALEHKPSAMIRPIIRPSTAPAVEPWSRRTHASSVW